MGYETKMYLAESQAEIIPGEKRYAKIVGMIDLCKVGGGEFMSLREKCLDSQAGESTHYFYADDGDTQITEDCYGDPIVELDPEEVLRALKTDNTNEPYRRFEVAIGMLEKFTQYFEGNKEDSIYPVVLTFGH
jgi:hypothetical protein